MARVLRRVTRLALDLQQKHFVCAASHHISPSDKLSGVRRAACTLCALSFRRQIGRNCRIRAWQEQNGGAGGMSLVFRHLWRNLLRALIFHPIFLSRVATPLPEGRSVIDTVPCSVLQEGRDLKI